MPSAVGLDFGDMPSPAPIRGRVTFGRLPSMVSFSPMEQAQIDAWERGDTNRGELVRALGSERNPQARQLLLDEYQQLFGGAAR